ncbi:MAG TPA: GNAT family N-acetyltransferase [Thermomicrobiales bacterium]|nr:GNAT family N-acetyltransferase [Thermomicrobiales bacterium]
MSASRDAWRVEPDAGDAAAYAALASDRLWAGYSIADLEPPFRAYTRVALARLGNEAAPAAACLFLRHPAFNSTIPHGDPAGVAAILAATAHLPAATYLLARDEHRPVLERHYDAAPAGWQEMRRMAVDAGTFRPPERPTPAVARLGPGDLAALRDLLAEYPDNAFNADQLASGVFYGARADGALVAAGGTHVLAARHGIAAVGNVYTRPAWRGRGYATAITAAVTAALLAGPCRDVILNVAAENGVARRLYARLGYREHCRYWEAAARQRAMSDER